jgi:hypothetical protein
VLRNGLVRDRLAVAVAGIRDRVGARRCSLPLPLILSLPLPRSLTLPLVHRKRVAEPGAAEKVARRVGPGSDRRGRLAPLPWAPSDPHRRFAPSLAPRGTRITGPAEHENSRTGGCAVLENVPVSLRAGKGTFSRGAPSGIAYRRSASQPPRRPSRRPEVDGTDRGSHSPHATAGRRAGAEARRAPNVTAGRCAGEPSPAPPRAPNPSESMIHVPGTFCWHRSRGPRDAPHTVAPLLVHPGPENRVLFGAPELAHRRACGTRYCAAGFRVPMGTMPCGAPPGMAAREARHSHQEGRRDAREVADVIREGRAVHVTAGRPPRGGARSAERDGRPLCRRTIPDAAARSESIRTHASCARHLFRDCTRMNDASRHRRAASRSGGATSAERDGRPVPTGDRTPAPPRLRIHQNP